MHYPVRHALIIAAGSGTRFGPRTQSRPKALLEVGGVPLIRRILLDAWSAGVDHFTVVTGFCSEILESFLRSEFPEKIRIQTLRNGEWERPNGLSVLRAERVLPARFFLLMSDHLFDPEILVRLQSIPLAPGHCRLGVDCHPENVPDLADATKVEVENGRIVNIGKEIHPFNAVDTGIFLCTHEIFAGLNRVVASGKETLSDGVRDLAIRRRMEAMDHEGRFWLDLDDERSLLEGERRLESQSNRLMPPLVFSEAMGERGIGGYRGQESTHVRPLVEGISD